MARRRRALSSCYCFSVSFSLVVVSFQERTSCPFLIFAQSRRRRFTESLFGVSLRVSDAELSRTRSLPPTASVRSPFEPSDLASIREGLELLAGVPRVSQIWISDPTSVILMPLIVRDPSMLNRRSVSSPSGFSDSDRSAPHDMQSSAVSTAITLSTLTPPGPPGFMFPPSAAAMFCQVPDLGQTMWKEVFSYWAWPINDFINFSFMGSFGSWPSWMFCLASHSSLIVSLQGALPTVWSLAPTTPGLPCDLLQDVRSGFVRAKQQTGLPPTGLGSCRTTFPQIWISDPNSASLMPFVGPNPFSLPSSSFLKERTISHVSSSELVWSLYRCFCVARSSPVCEVCCSEISFSVIFKGSSNWCLVAFGTVAELMIVFSGLVAKAISNNRPLLVGIVSHGTFSPPASHVVKDRGLCDDFVCLRIGTVCLYLFIYCSYAFSLALVTTLLVILMVLNFMFVTNSSRVGE